jgi:hypothetical protein
VQARDHDDSGLANMTSADTARGKRGSLALLQQWIPNRSKRLARRKTKPMSAVTITSWNTQLDLLTWKSATSDEGSLTGML